jgi:hypothetical protein
LTRRNSITFINDIIHHITDDEPETQLEFDTEFIFFFLFRYESWLRGEDYGRHPEEPNGKSTAAPQPTAEEFIFNPKNKDKPIPLCLLEPNASKKRRHPIHKKKSIGEIFSNDKTLIDISKRVLRFRN